MTDRGAGTGRATIEKAGAVEYLYLDFEGSDLADNAKFVEAHRQFVRSRPPEKRNILANVRGAPISRASFEEWRIYFKEEKPVLNKTAICGAQGMVRMASAAIRLMMLPWFPETEDRMRLFKNKDQALAWLSEKTTP